MSFFRYPSAKYKDGDRIYEVLGDAFQDPDNTHVRLSSSSLSRSWPSDAPSFDFEQVYAYIFRLVTINAQPVGPAPTNLLTGGQATPPSRSESPALPVVTLDRPPSVSSASSSRQTTPRSHPTQSKPSSSQSSPALALSSGDLVDQELQELFRRIEKGDELSKVRRPSHASSRFELELTILSLLSLSSAASRRGLQAADRASQQDGQVRGACLDDRLGTLDVHSSSSGSSSQASRIGIPCW